ncbi:MAG: NAD(P)H:quinone oxidoreductase [Moraxella sp.]|nr:NAD(P)H:quinone oxidoreductase [Moraxella sp.]
MAPYVLVLYDSTHGATRQLAYLIAEGVLKAGVEVKIRCVPKVSTVCEQVAPSIPSEGDIYCSQADLIGCAAVALGSPTHFGNMSASMKYFWDNTVAVWLSGQLQGKPACVFTSTGSLHGGQESTLLTMMLPLLHHGMMVLGLPYAHGALSKTQSGGTPYGVSHWAGTSNEKGISGDEKTLAIAQGERLAWVVKKLGE